MEAGAADTGFVDTKRMRRAFLRAFRPAASTD
jgi:transcriptional regulator GlxA family with amidase domain